MHQKARFVKGPRVGVHLGKAWLGGWACWAALAALPASGFEAQGRLQGVDLEGRTVSMFANGQDRKVAVAADVQVVDEAGRPLAEGLASSSLKAGTAVTVSVERGERGPVVRRLQLGVHARAAEAGPTGRPSVGLKPLNALSVGDRYKGEEGGLYGGGRDEPPAALATAAARATARIVPLDAAGQPAADGKIGLLSLSMSNATMEFSLFKQLADADPQKSPAVAVVDGAQGGQAMAEWVDPAARPWAEVERRLAQAGVSARQVQVLWVKLANKHPTGELAEHVGKLKSDTAALLRNAQARFPNLRIAYLSSRIYGGYAASALNPEPYAYEGAFAVRGLILDQARGDPELACSGAGAKAPLLMWGPYLWADGNTPRPADGLVWERADFAADGTHPSDSGRRKVADLLLKFFKEDPHASSWFVARRP